MLLSACTCCVMGLVLTSTCVLVGLFPPTHALPLHTPDPPTGAEPYLHLPVSVHFRIPRVDKRYFSPAHVNSRNPLPKRVRQVLVPAPRRRTEPRDRPTGPVSVACNAKEMRVRVHTANLGASGARMHVRLGTCDVSRQTERSVLFQYDLHECGTRRQQMINQTLVYSNMLRYTPDASVLGSETFSVPVACRFNRFHYSYKIGYVPSVEKLKFFKPMKTKGSVSLTACDAQWNRLSPSETVVIGQPMYFEAETLYVPEDERLFVHFCHVTTNSSRVSSPHINVINNYGCLMDSKRSGQSRFINSTRRNVVRFIVDAFTLQGNVQKYLFIHCEMSIRSIIPTQTSKLCSYNQLEHRWEELHGADSVCSCCDSTCVPERPTLMRPLTSELGTLVAQSPEGTGRKNPAQSREGIFTPKPEQETLMMENLQETIVPERRLPLEHEHRITLESTPTSDSRSTSLTTESEHSEITPETPPTLKSEHRALTLEHESRTRTPVRERGWVTPETPPTPVRERGWVTPETPPTPARERGWVTPETPPTPARERGWVTPEAPPTPARERGWVTPEAPPTPVRERGWVTPETPPTPVRERGWVTLETPPTPVRERGWVTLETPPTPVRERGWVTPETPVRERGTPTLDAMQEKITLHTNETLIHSDEHNTTTPVYTQPLEPYRIFEEVFGLS
ncbi:hypothetical protein QTP70_026432 [Hemibagrus guttatus]|uniref:Zona pellucida sperm-binding protein 3 n=1 Tax=Hemibagrus guttatus TaxID=175788 RepID=A0AAE0Q8F3_9TELE|nr:hypothetical protein QTP70_026432 [Hemibagrus guttatus]